MDGEDSSVGGTQPENDPDGCGCGCHLSKPKTPPPANIIDLSCHPAHGNMLLMKQSEAAQLLGVSTITLNVRFRARFPQMRWPWRQCESLRRQIDRTNELCAKGRITEEIREARVKQMEDEMALLVKGPVEINL